MDAVTATAEATPLLRLRLAADAPAGAQEVPLELDVQNLHVGPGRTLTVRVPLAITVRAR
jgi:hypothetical protein